MKLLAGLLMVHLTMSGQTKIDVNQIRDLVITLPPDTTPPPNPTPTSNICTVSITDGKNIKIFPNATPSSPCIISMGEADFKLTQPATVTLTGTTPSTFFISVNGDGVIDVRGGTSATCVDCAYFTGTTYPLFTRHIGTVTTSAGIWDKDSFKSDVGYSGPVQFTNNGSLVISPLGTRILLAVDSAIVPLKVAVPLTSTSTCSQNSFAYNNQYFYLCVETNKWMRIPLQTW